MLVSRTIAAVAAAATLVVGLTAAPAASQKDDTPPPVVVDDTISVYPYEVREIDLFANDSSPSGQELHLCRLAELEPDGMEAPVLVFPTGDGGTVQVLAFDLRGDEVDLTYHACDDEHVTSGTLTVDVKDVEPVEVVKTGKPGQLEVTNTNDAKVVFKWGGAKVLRPDGRIAVAAGATELIQVTRKRIQWIAMIGRGGVADVGRVRGIELPR